MRWYLNVLVGFVLVAGTSTTILRSQEGGAGGAQAQARKFLAPATQVIAVRAGRLFDSKTGAMLNNHVILIRGDRITDVGPSVQIPSGTRVIDLGSVTVLPGMIDTHVHVNTGGETPAQRVLIAMANALTDLEAG